MPFTGALPRLPSHSAEKVRHALDAILALMATPPAVPQRIEDESEDMTRLARALRAVGQAFEEAGLMRDILREGAWRVTSPADGMVRAMMHKFAFTSYVTHFPSHLSIVLTQRASGRERPMIDPNFFQSIRASLEDFRDVVWAQVQPWSPPPGQPGAGLPADLVSAAEELARRQAEARQEQRDRVDREARASELVSRYMDVVAQLGSLWSDADFRGAAFDPAPFVPLLADRLVEAVRGLDQLAAFRTWGCVDMEALAEQGVRQSTGGHPRSVEGERLLLHAARVLVEQVRAGEQVEAGLTQALGYPPLSRIASVIGGLLLGLADGRVLPLVASPASEAAPEPEDGDDLPDTSSGTCEDAPLAEREMELLQAMHALGALGEKRRMTLRKIVRKVDPAAKEGTYKRPLASLAKRGFVITKIGQDGGSWLTPAGVERAARTQSRPG